jgi:hypothetical protein
MSHYPQGKNFYFTYIIEQIKEKKSPYSVCSKNISKQKLNINPMIHTYGNENQIIYITAGFDTIRIMNLE